MKRRKKPQDMAKTARQKHPELVRLAALNAYRALTKANRELVKSVALYRRDPRAVCNELGIPNATHHFNQKNIQDCLRAFKAAGGSPIVPPPVTELALEMEKAAKAEPKPEAICETAGCDKPVRFNGRLCGFHGALSIGLEAIRREVPQPTITRPGDPPRMTVVPTRPARPEPEPSPATNAITEAMLFPRNRLNRGNDLANSQRIWVEQEAANQEERQRLIRQLEAQQTGQHWR
jgi:hypothetical protein